MELSNHDLSANILLFSSLNLTNELQYAISLGKVSNISLEISSILETILEECY